MLWGPIESLRITLADCDSFRGLVGAATREDSLAKILGEYADTPVAMLQSSLAAGEIDQDEYLALMAQADQYIAAQWEDLRPYAQIWYAPSGWSYNRVAAKRFKANISLELFIECDTRHVPGVTEIAREQAFYDLLGNIINEMIANSGVYPYADIASIVMESGRQTWSRSEKAGQAGLTDAEVYSCRFKVDLGNRESG